MKKIQKLLIDFRFEDAIGLIRAARYLYVFCNYFTRVILTAISFRVGLRDLFEGSLLGGVTNYCTLFSNI